MAKKDYLERYAFLWDIDRLHPVDATAPYRFVTSPKINNPTFRQVPIVGDVKVAGGNGFDFRILTIHTVFNEALNQVRKAEIQFVNDWTNILTFPPEITRVPAYTPILWPTATKSPAR